MGKTTGYWLPISLWNLNELFTTESFSPYKLNKSKGFGNPVGRKKEEFENEAFLTLYRKQPSTDICLKIRSEAIDSEYADDRGEHINYYKTIFLKRGNFFLFFYDQRLIKLFSVNTKMLLEVKCEAKYAFTGNQWPHPTFQIFKETPPLSILTPDNSIPKFDCCEQRFFDKAFNQVKGLIFGLLRGIIGQPSEMEVVFENQLRTLKNEIAGRRTNISMNAIYDGDWCFIIFRSLNIVTEQCKRLMPAESTRQLETLSLMLNSIDDLFQKKSKVLAQQHSDDYKNQFELCYSDLERAKRDLYDLEVILGIDKFIEHLKEIKEQERKKGEAKGKLREYYPKGSGKANWKADLKDMIKSFESHPSYIKLKRDVAVLEEQIRKFRFGITDYDSTIDDQFSRISDYLNDLILKSTKYFKETKIKELNAPNLSGLNVDLSALICHYKHPEQEICNFIKSLPYVVDQFLTVSDTNMVVMALNVALKNSIYFQSEISNDQTLRFVAQLKKQYEESDQLIKEVEYLRDNIRYKANEIKEFAYPVENVILQNIFACILKPDSFEQLDKFLKEKKVGSNWVAFSVWASFLGFANLPKTFTNLIYESENEEIFENIDNFLFSNLIDMAN